MTGFRVKKGQILYEDGEDQVVTVFLQKKVNIFWANVLELQLESGRAWGDKVDLLYRHKSTGELIIHIEGHGFWGDSEYYRSIDGGDSWEPLDIARIQDPTLYEIESLDQVD